MSHYVQIKNKIVIGYYGNAHEYLVQLKLVRPFIEAKFPGLEIYLTCRDEAFGLLQDEPRVLPNSKLMSSKQEFGFIKNIVCNMQVHPVLQLMSESHIPIEPVPVIKKLLPKTCIICPQGVFPTKYLSNKEIQLLEKEANSEGYQVISGDVSDEVGWVIGPENEQVFRAAAQGIKTTLVESGLGTELYQKLFPDGLIKKFIWPHR